MPMTHESAESYAFRRLSIGDQPADIVADLETRYGFSLTVAAALVRNAGVHATRSLAAPAHTLGPLQAQNGDCWYLTNDAGETVAILRGPDVAQEAYARVFAAAPDMTDALRRFVNLAGHPCFPDTGEVPAFAVQVSDARALLARLDSGQEGAANG